MNWWKSWRLKRQFELLSNSPDSELRKSVVSNLKTDADSVPLLVLALEDKFSTIGIMAAKKLGDIRDARAIGPLLAA